jgi:ankyrin repeat protein
MLMTTDENADANFCSSECDPMSLLLDAKLENIAAFDASEAKRLQRTYEVEHEAHEDLRIALLIQSEEDSTALNSEALIERDFQLASEAQEAEARAIKLQEEKDLLLASQAQAEEEKEFSAFKEQLTKDTEIARQLHEELVTRVSCIVTKGDVLGLKGLVEGGLDCSITSSVGLQHSPLQLSVKSHQFEACKILLENRAAVDWVDASGDTALHNAAESNKLAFIKLLLEAKAKVDVKNKLGQTALTLAAKGGYGEAVELLLQGGAYIYHKDGANKMPLQYVPFLSRSLKSKLEGMMGWGLLEAARKGRGDSVMSLMDRGASVFLSDEHNRTALHYAAGGGHSLVVEFLLQRSADPSVLDRERQTPLHKAAAANAVHVYVTLLRHGARPTLDAKGRLPLHLCCNPTIHSQMTLAEAAAGKNENSTTKDP